VHDVPTTQQRDCQPGWQSDAVDVLVLTALLLGVTLAVLL
jgi:hypothetical protein